MIEDFWVKITKPSFFYVVEIWSAGEDRILYVEKKKRLTKFGAKKIAKRCIMEKIYLSYIKEKYD